MCVNSIFSLVKYSKWELEVGVHSKSIIWEIIFMSKLDSDSDTVTTSHSRRKPY